MPPPSRTHPPLLPPPANLIEQPTPFSATCIAALLIAPQKANVKNTMNIWANTYRERIRKEMRQIRSTQNHQAGYNQARNKKKQRKGTKSQKQSEDRGIETEEESDEEEDTEEAMQTLDVDDQTTEAERQIASEIIPQIIPAMQSNSAMIRLRAVKMITYATRAMSSMDEDITESILDNLKLRMNDKITKIRCAAAEALILFTRIEQRNEWGLIPLILAQMETDPASEVRKLLLAILPVTPDTLSPMLNRLTDNAAAVRLTAINILKKHLTWKDAPAELRSTILSTLRSDPFPQLRLQADTLISQWVDECDNILSFLLGDDDGGGIDGMQEDVIMDCLRVVWKQSEGVPEFSDELLAIPRFEVYMMLKSYIANHPDAEVISPSTVLDLNMNVLLVETIPLMDIVDVRYKGLIADKIIEWYKGVEWNQRNTEAMVRAVDDVERLLPLFEDLELQLNQMDLGNDTAIVKGRLELLKGIFTNAQPRTDNVLFTLFDDYVLRFLTSDNTDIRFTSYECFGALCLLEKDYAVENMRNFLTAWEESKKADFRVLCTKVIDVIVPLLKFSSTRNKIIIDILMMFGCPSDLTEDVTSVLKRGVGSRNLSLKFASCDGILRLGLEKRLSDRELIGRVLIAFFKVTELSPLSAMIQAGIVLWILSSTDNCNLNQTILTEVAPSIFITVARNIEDGEETMWDPIRMGSVLLGLIDEKYFLSHQDSENPPPVTRGLQAKFALSLLKMANEDEADEVSDRMIKWIATVVAKVDVKSSDRLEELEASAEEFRTLLKDKPTQSLFAKFLENIHAAAEVVSQAGSETESNLA